MILKKVCEFIHKFIFIIVILKNLIFRKTRYRLHFYSKIDENNEKYWYYDWNKDHFIKWPFDEHNLEMVAGADILCELKSNNKDSFYIDIVATNNKLDNNSKECFIKKEIMFSGTLLEKFVLGAEYENEKTKSIIWVCPVTLFVLGRYPNYLYI